jgi:hypothetical protein
MRVSVLVIQIVQEGAACVAPLVLLKITVSNSHMVLRSSSSSPQKKKKNSPLASYAFCLQILRAGLMAVSVLVFQRD